MGKFGDAGIGVSQEGDQQADPADLGGFNSDDGDGFVHGPSLLKSFRPGFGFYEPVRNGGRRRVAKFREIHDFGGARDKKFVSPFLKHAEEIFQAAREGGLDDCDLAILVGRDGGIHMLAGIDWELDPLRRHHGASAAYRISRTAGGVRVEARSADESCLLQTTQPVRLMPAMLPDFPQYLTVH